MVFRLTDRINVNRDWLKADFKTPNLTIALALAWLAFVCGLVFLWNLGNIGLIDETEPLFAEAARQMNVRQDWITPYFNENTRFDKPALIYWLMAIAYQVLGVNEWAVRLPSALAAIALTFFLFYTSSQIAQNRTFTVAQPWIGACLAATMFAFNPQTIAWARVGVSDMLLCAGMGGAMLAFFLGYVESDTQTPKRGILGFQSHWYLAFYVLSGFAVLTKGPVGIVLPILILGCFGLYVGQGRQIWREMQPGRGSLVFGAIALPWYIAVSLANGQDYLNAFFGYHNFERFTSVVNHHAAPWYFYVPVVLIGFAPWSIFLPLAIAKTRFWQRRFWMRQPRSEQFHLFAFWWFACIFGFFTIAITKLPSYVLPLIPACTLLVADFWRDPKTFTQTPKPLLWTFSLINLGLALVLAVVIPYSPRWLGGDPAMPNLPEVLQASGLLIRAPIILGLAAVIGLIFLGRRSWRGLWGANLMGILALFIGVIMPLFFLLDGQRQLPLRQLAQTLVTVRSPQERVLMVGFEKPSLVFYTQSRVKYLLHTDRAQTYLQQEAREAPEPPTILILAYPSRITALGLKPNQYQVLNQAGAYQLIRVAKSQFSQIPVFPNPQPLE